MEGKDKQLLIIHRNIKINEGVWRRSSTVSLRRALDGSERSTARPADLPSEEEQAGTSWFGGWVGPSLFLNAVNRRIFSSSRKSTPPDFPLVNPTA